MRESFTYMFKDTGFKNKAIVYFTICFLAYALTGYAEVSTSSFFNTVIVTPVKGYFLLLLQIVGLFFYLIMCGYYFNCINAIVKQQNNIVLPLLNIKNSLIKGIRFYLSALILVLPLAVIYIAVCYINEIFSFYLGIILLIFIGSYAASFTWLFSVENRLTAFFNWKRAFNLVKQNFKLYCTNYLLVLILYFVGAFVSYFIMYILTYLFKNSFIPYILSTIVTSAIVVYISFVGMYLIAKSIKPSDV